MLFGGAGELVWHAPLEGRKAATNGAFGCCYFFYEILLAPWTRLARDSRLWGGVVLGGGGVEFFRYVWEAAWVGHFFINFHGGIRTIPAMEPPLPHSLLPYPAPVLSLSLSLFLA